MYDLSMLIPARNEMFLKQTVQNILENIEGNTEIIVIADGTWPDPALEQHQRVTVVHHPISIGQRAATNEAARISKAKYIAKCDAHCAFDKGFDVKLMQDCEKDWTVIPRMYNLHAFDWKCNKCGNTTYQGPTPTSCAKCDNKTDFERVMIWQPRWNRQSDFMRFDRDLHFQYWGDFKRRPEAEGDICDLMCFLGACFFMHRERYWEIDGLDESHGSWGQMGVEISCKSWLSGGRMVVNKKTWFAHMFRTQGGDFGFPYHLSGKDVQVARNHSRELWQEGRWPKAKHTLTWLINKFGPVPTWESEGKTPLTKGIVFYTDSRGDETVLSAVRKQLKKTIKDEQIISVSLKPLDFGTNIVFPGERGYLTMFKQILAGLEKSTADIVFLCEHDVLYHPSHFNFVPPKEDVYYYNEHTYKLNASSKVDASNGQAVFYHTKQTSGLCAYRKLLLQHYQERVRRVEKEGFTRKMGFEPGTHSPPNGIDNFKAEAYWSTSPNVDVRHDFNLTESRFSPDQFRSKRSIIGWKLVDEIPDWGKTKDRFNDFLKDHSLF